jgi:hypothetical protein
VGGQEFGGASIWAAVVAVLAASCGGSGGGDAKVEVERMIRSQLPGSVKRNTGEAVFVDDVTCVSKGGGDYDCIAVVTGTDGVGGLRSLDVPITASCERMSRRPWIFGGGPVVIVTSLRR